MAQVPSSLAPAPAHFQWLFTSLHLDTGDYYQPSSCFSANWSAFPALLRTLGCSALKPVPLARMLDVLGRHAAGPACRAFDAVCELQTDDEVPAVAGPIVGDELEAETIALCRLLHFFAAPPHPTRGLFIYHAAAARALLSKYSHLLFCFLSTHMLLMRKKRSVSEMHVLPSNDAFV